MNNGRICIRKRYTYIKVYIENISDHTNTSVEIKSGAGAVYDLCRFCRRIGVILEVLIIDCSSV